MINRIFRNLAIFTFGIVLLGLGFYFFNNSTYVYKGSSYAPFPEAPNFQLTDQNGSLFELDDRKGQVILLFFGYTNCPDICPATLAEFGRIRAGLGDKADEVNFVFVTEDPDRDTQARLKEYLANFDPAIIGLTGSMEELQPVWSAYYIAREKELVGDSEDEYSIAHTSRIYVIDKFGRLRLTFPNDMSVADMIADVSHLVSEASNE